MKSELYMNSASLRPFDLLGHLASLLLALPLALALVLPLTSRAQPSTVPPAPTVQSAPAVQLAPSTPSATEPATPVPGVKQSESGPIEVSAPVEGEVRKIEPTAQKLTLQHAPIPSLEIDETVKEFRVADPAMLEDVKPGDRVRFTVERANGALTVTALEPLRNR